MTTLPITQSGPYPVDLEPGEYLWCACGHSRSHPFCDNSHDGTGFAPVRMVVAEKCQVHLCGCEYTSTPPLCDGSHGRHD